MKVEFSQTTKYKPDIKELKFQILLLDAFTDFIRILIYVHTHTQRYSHPHSNPQCPTPLWQSSKHLQANKIRITTHVMSTNLQRTEDSKAHQEKSRTLGGSLSPRLRSTPTLKIENILVQT